MADAADCGEHALIEDAQPILIGEILEPARPGRSDGVDQRVDLAPRCRDLRDGGGHLVVLRGVGAEGEDRPRTGFLHHPHCPLERVGVPAENGDPSASRGQALRHGQADTARSTADDTYRTCSHDFPISKMVSYHTDIHLLSRWKWGSGS